IHVETRPLGGIENGTSLCNVNPAIFGKKCYRVHDDWTLLITMGRRMRNMLWCWVPIEDKK
ncbi:MAG: hypothetical protein NTX92_06365, partial [Euryarchaeota archaeon]|nr:hypothetical protein [Euryarchaeota archaeon]